MSAQTMLARKLKFRESDTEMSNKKKGKKKKKRIIQVSDFKATNRRQSVAITLLNQKRNQMMQVSN